MGYAVLHMEKASATDSGMSAHIERTIAPKNADPNRTHLNREMIAFPDGVQNRTQAIQHRLDTAELQRKIGKNQVRAIRILLTGSPEDMKRIEQKGKLNEWCSDNLDWLRKTYGKENIVSAVLHLDETTPHIHATMTPIVTGERRKAKSEQAAGRKKYRKKDTSAARLCADDVMSRVKLKEYQNSYAEQMAKYGLQRGIEGSEAKHITTSQYYRDLLDQTESIQVNIHALLEQQEAARIKLAKVTSEISKEKLKSSASEVGSKLMDGVSMLLGTPQVVKTKNENKQLKDAILALHNENKAIRLNLEEAKKEAFAEVDGLKQQLVQELKTTKEHYEQREEALKKENDRYKLALSKVFVWFPLAKELLKTEGLCKAIGLTTAQITTIFRGMILTFTGSLYSEEHKRKFSAQDSKIRLHISEDKSHSVLIVDGKHVGEWFKQKYEDLKLSASPKQESEKRKGMKF